MRPVRSLVVYLVLIFAGGALVAPGLYWFGQHLSPYWARLGAEPFHRYEHRAMLGLALLGLWPLLRALDMASLRAIGLTSPARHWQRVGEGIAAAIAPLAIVSVLTICVGARSLVPSLFTAQIGWKLLGAFLSAVAVGVLEEVLFRGVMFNALRKTFHWKFALVQASLFYALLHFLQNGDVSGPVTASSGFRLLPVMLRGFADWRTVFPGFINLTLAGVLLGFACERTGNLWFSIALHAGWVFWVKLYGTLTLPVPGSADWWWGSGQMANGWMGLLPLLFLLYVFTRSWPEPERRRDFGRPELNIGGSSPAT